MTCKQSLTFLLKQELIWFPKDSNSCAIKFSNVILMSLRTSSQYMIVSLNRVLKRPVWDGESSNQLLRHLDPQAKFFACFDAISGYHQIRVDDESSKLLNVITQMGNYRFTMLGQGICSSQDLFNFITDRGSKLDEGFNCLKNIDDFLLFSDTLQGLEEQIKKLIK